LLWICSNKSDNGISTMETWCTYVTEFGRFWAKDNGFWSHQSHVKIETLGSNETRKPLGNTDIYEVCGGWTRVRHWKLMVLSTLFCHPHYVNTLIL
jgi:hypothetical protein